MRSKNSSAAGRPKHAGSSRVIVGEGKTEVGLLRTYGDFWVHDHGASLAQKGISIVDGGGQNAAKRALDLASLGFPVLLVADSDVELKPSAATLRAAGVVVVQWAGTMSTEQRLAADLSPEGLQAAFDAVVAEDREPAHVADAILASEPGAAALRRLGAGRNDVGDDLEALRAAGLTDEEIREAFGATAKGKSAWFKRIDHGETLGRIAVSDPTIPSTAFGNALSMVEKWCHG
jgi:putative ATP-dependent endonuclease of the OLD family